MTLPSLIWGSPQWIALALGAIAVGALAILWSYAPGAARPSVRIAAARS